MKKITNKNVALLAIIPLAIFPVLGFIEGFIGYTTYETLLPPFVDWVIGAIGAVLMLYALYRLYKAPDSSSFSE